MKNSVIILVLPLMLAGCASGSDFFSRVAGLFGQEAPVQMAQVVLEPVAVAMPVERVRRNRPRSNRVIASRPVTSTAQLNMAQRPTVPQVTRVTAAGPQTVRPVANSTFPLTVTPPSASSYMLRVNGRVWDDMPEFGMPNMRR